MRKTFTSLILVSVLAVSLMGCGKEEETAAPVQAEESLTPVQTAKVVEGTLDIKAGITGTLQPKETVLVSPKVSAKISKVNVELGDPVKAGDVLFTMDATDLSNVVHQEQAAYDYAAATLKQIETNKVNGTNQAEESLKLAQNTLVQRKQALDVAKANLQRIQQLFASGATSAVEVEGAETNLQAAETAYQNAQVAVQQAEATLNHARKVVDIEVAQAALKQASVRLQNAREQLANSTVVSPISGVVSVVNGATGQMAGPQSPVVTVVQIDPIIAKAHLSEQERNGIKVGTRAEIEVPSLNQKLEAAVSALSPVIDPDLKAYPVEFSIPNSALTLQADMVVNVKFADQGYQATKALIIPTSALVQEQGKRYVYKLNGDTVQKTEVTLGEETSTQTIVKTGLKADDEIVTRGQSLLKDGAKVKVQKTE